MTSQLSDLRGIFSRRVWNAVNTVLHFVKASDVEFREGARNKIRSPSFYGFPRVQLERKASMGVSQ